MDRERGDHEAYEMLVASVADRLYVTAYRMVQDSDQAIPGGCGSGEYVFDAWIGIYDPATGAFRPTPDPIAGTAGLPFDTDRQYRAAALLSDGRVALIEEDFESSEPNAVDIVDLSP